MIAVKVNKISFHPPSRSYAVILKEIDGERRLPVIVGAFEAQSIALALEYMETPRPLTHDLIGNIIKGIGSKLKTVKITTLKDSYNQGLDAPEDILPGQLGLTEESELDTSEE